MKSESNQYWAWEFLRRNHVYRDAFALATSVTSEQQGSLQGTADRVLALSEIDPNLPYRAFFAPFDPMCDWDDDHEMADRVLELAFDWSVGEMLELLIPEARSRSVVTLLDECNLESYALETWVDPTLPASNVDENIFRPSIGRGFGLSKIEAPEKTHEGATNPDGFRLQTFTIPDARRVYHSKREARPKQKVDGSFGYQGKNGQHFSRGSKVIVALSPTDVVFKLALALPLGPQLELVEKCAAEHLEDLKAAGICEELNARRNGDSYNDYLMLLDGIDEGVTGGELAERLGRATLNTMTGLYEAEGFVWNKAPNARDNLRQMTRRARALRDYQFLNLALS